MGDGSVVDLRKAMPDAWRVFFRERQLRPVQQEAAPPLLRGESVLLSGPTASGKTEAVLAPLYQRHVSFQRTRVGVVYVAPTKALVNDMFERLTGYFAGGIPGIVQRYTGDHHEFGDPAGRFVLLATPEALDSLQLMQPSLLDGVRVVVCDELHLLHGAARGQQLRAVIARLRAHASPPRDGRDAFQIVGMSATVRDAETVARVWCGTDAMVLKVEGSRAIDMSVLQAPKKETAQAIADMLRTGEGTLGLQKALVFADSRNRAHLLAVALARELKADGWPVFLHIGILSRSERERVETAMKTERRALCVATSTLEVGIDIGDIDVVVLADPPTSVSSMLQRLGRGNRRSKRCVVWACAADQWESRVINAVYDCAARGELDDVHDYTRPAVQFQQAIGAAWAGLRRDSPLTLTNLEERTGGAVSSDVVDDMVTSGALRQMRSALLPSDEWCDYGDARKLHSVLVSSGGVPLVDVQSGETIAEVSRGADARGTLYAGGGLRVVHGADDRGVYVGTQRGASTSRLVRLPSARGRFRGLSRQVVWSMARSEGHDPASWIRDGATLTTWGGAAYNLLLKGILVRTGQPKKLRHDDLGIDGLTEDVEVTAEFVLRLAEDMFEADGVPDALARRFREPTQFLHALSPAMAREEARRSVPRRGFIEWLAECSA